MAAKHYSAVFDKEYNIPRIRELALGAVPQSVVVTDRLLEGNPIIYVNAAFERLTGYEASEVIGRDFGFMAGPETSAEVRKLMRDAVENNLPFQGLALNYRKDGSQFWNDITIVPIDDGPDAQYFVGIQVDVTERLALEASLRESQKMEALGKLSGGIAHDFNNILAIIMGNAEIIASEATAGSPLLEAAIDIIEASDGGSSLVARMLQFARGQPEMTESISVNQVVRDVIALLGRSIGDAVRLEVDLSAAVNTVNIDKTLLETAIVNLVLNARDAMPRGGTVRIATRRRANVGPGLENAVVLTVSDSGNGMDRETQRRAFEPFFTTKDAGRGTGLGLSMVYRFVRQSGGDAKIESKPGEGTVISLILPLEGPARVAHSGGDASPCAPRVLVVEDDAKLRKMLAMHLLRAGYVVDEAANAAEAIELIRADLDHELVISDIQMGSGMSGIDLVAAVRAEKPGMPMLLITGFADQLDDHPSHIDGVPILRKPFRTKQLLETVTQMLGGVGMVA